MNKEILTRTEASNLLGVKPETLKTWRRKGIIKVHAEVNGRPRFHIDEVNRLLKPISN
jgi:predicted site-specific integrase-resolvase